MFENSRKKSINSFQLVPAHYLSTLGYSWDAILRFTDVNSKLISDIDKQQFIGIIIRGGISMICKAWLKLTTKS